MTERVIYDTENSVYEVDKGAKKIRRVSGVNPPTQRFKEDGVWHEYDQLTLDHDGMIIEWPDNGEGRKFTFTSQAVARS